MSFNRIAIPVFTALAVGPLTPLGAWHPAFHEAQTRTALRLIPRGMGEFLAPHTPQLLAASRGVGNAQPPTVDEVAAQFIRVVQLSEARKRPAELARELGVLAQMAQLLLDPSATRGVTALRESFELLGQERRAKLVVSREPYWALHGPLDPYPALERLAAEKAERTAILLEHFEVERGRRKGTWDDLSIPFAMLQTSYSRGVNLTVNLYILLWRACGNLWVPPAVQSPSGRD